jgi:hypothetical protein
LGKVFQFYCFHGSSMIENSIYLNPLGRRISVHECVRV